MAAIGTWKMARSQYPPSGQSSWYPRRTQTPLVDEALQVFLDQAMEHRVRLGRKFEEKDLLQEEGLIYQTLAEVYIRQYTGDFSFILELQQKLAQYGSLSPAQLKGALNTLIVDESRRREEAPSTPSSLTKNTPPPQRNPVHVESVPSPAIPYRGIVQGWYTIVLPDQSHVTLRLRETDEYSRTRFDLPEHTLTVGYLRGSSNSDESSYEAFGWLKGGTTLVLFKRFRDDIHFARQRQAVQVLLGEADPKIFGKAYAMESHKCWICGRLLTTPESLEAGIGPECAKKLG